MNKFALSNYIKKGIKHNNKKKKINEMLDDYAFALEGLLNEIEKIDIQTNEKNGLNVGLKTCICKKQIGQDGFVIFDKKTKEKKGLLCKDCAIKLMGKHRHDLATGDHSNYNESTPVVEPEEPDTITKPTRKTDTPEEEPDFDPFTPPKYDPDDDPAPKARRK